MKRSFASSSLVRIGDAHTIWRHESGPGSSRLPSGPIDELSDVTSASKFASSGGFVTCANSCLK